MPAVPTKRRAGRESTKLRDFLLVSLLADREPVRRYELAERPLSSRRWSRRERTRPSASSEATHREHLAERADAAIDHLYHQDKLLERPRRGYYCLNAAGRREARKLPALPKPTVRPALPVWARTAKVGSWKRYVPPATITTHSPAPFTWDAEDKDANTQEHVDTLNTLNAILEQAEIEAVEGMSRPNCDLAYVHRRGLVIIEAKSLPRGSDDHQMRLGLGQVLDYRANLSAGKEYPHVKAILAVPRTPERVATWQRACEDAHVTLLIASWSVRRLKTKLLG